MKVGTLAYATEQGLGILAHSFYQAGIVDEVLVIRHSSRPTREDWYPGATHLPISGVAVPKVHDWIMAEEIGLLLFFETPFNWSLIERCRSWGVKTVLMPMYECMPTRLPAEPDYYLNPSALDAMYYPQRSLHLPVPVEVEWRLRSKAEVFVHNAGHGGLKNRNGTGVLLDAWKLVKSPAPLLLRTQDKLKWAVDDPRIRVQTGTILHAELWRHGDVFVFPETFNGLSLPLQEARGAGMLVMCGDRFPMNAWLPKDPLFPVLGYAPNRIGPAYNEFSEASYDPKEIAAKVDEWYGKDIQAYSEEGRRWAEENSWAKLGPVYRETLERWAA